MELASASRELAEIIRSAVNEQLSRIDEAGLMFSGGLDSTILALAARKKCDLTLYTMGVEGSHDIEWVRECASIIDLSIVEVIVDRDKVRRSMERVVRQHEMSNSKWMSTFVGFDLVLANVKEKHVICGQGADELFGGYRKYKKGDARSAMAADFAELRDREMPQYQKMANYYGKVLIAPFFNKELAEFSSELPNDVKITEGSNKYILRQAAKVLGVPDMISLKEKKAMQYGSGISKEIKSIVKGSDLQVYMNSL